MFILKNRKISFNHFDIKKYSLNICLATTMHAHVKTLHINKLSNRKYMYVFVKNLI